MFTASQLVAHLFGDFILQTSWMAERKTKSSWACFVHVFFYTVTFLSITWNPIALILIGGSHFVIDRWGLARYLVWARNIIGPREFRYSWKEAESNFGFSQQTEAYLAHWLLIIIDNITHILINGLVISYIV